MRVSLGTILPPKKRLSKFLKMVNVRTSWTDLCEPTVLQSNPLRSSHNPLEERVYKLENTVTLEVSLDELVQYENSSNFSVPKKGRIV